MRYSTDVDPDKTAKAFGYELHCSRKDSQNLAYVLKGMKVEDGKVVAYRARVSLSFKVLKEI